MNGAGKPFSAYAKNVRVLRHQETTEPEPVTVVSDRIPSGGGAERRKVSVEAPWMGSRYGSRAIR